MKYILTKRNQRERERETDTGQEVSKRRNNVKQESGRGEGRTDLEPDRGNVERVTGKQN